MTTDFAQLMEQLADREPAVRSEAAQQLARLEHGGRAAALPLVRASVDEDPEVRDWVVAALEGVGAPGEGDLDELAALVADPHVDISYWAATLLGRAGTAKPEVIAALARGVRTHQSPQARRRSAWALGKIGDRSETAREALLEAAQSDDRTVAMAARTALAQIEGEPG